MIKTIIGLILLLIPFLLIYKFKDKKVGFVYVLSFLIAFHLLLAVFTQVFGIFNYAIVLGINLVADFVILIKINFKEFRESIKKINAKKIDWVFIFVLIILFIQLYSVHYNYTGEISVIRGYENITNMNYPYPYFSDEWSAVTFIKYSISSGKLPLTNPYWHDTFFPNLELPFHSLISEIILLLNLNPLTHYAVLTIFSGLLICSLVYFILRVNKIGKLASSIATLSLLYIVNGANLPGIWNLIPITLGIISLLSSFLFISADNKKMALFTGLLTLIFYPPLVLFSAVSLISYLIFNTKKEKTKYILAYFLIIVISAIFVSVFTYLNMNISLENFVFSYIKGKIFYSTSTPNAFPAFHIWKIIPIPSLILAGFAAVFLFKIKNIKKKIWLVAPIIVGLIYWLCYSKVFWNFIIGYARVVFSTSILIVLLSGFGLHYITEYFKRIKLIKKYKILTIIQIFILAVFFIFSFSYTQRNNWQALKLYPVDSVISFSPAAPANIYLNEDDLKLFRNIEKKRFLSVPWKGTAIGTATSNYPLDTKSATLTNRLLSYGQFMKEDCDGKTKLAEKYKINYIYSREFKCDRFELRGNSKEELYLYEFIIG